jgi:hypothetical protein
MSPTIQQTLALDQELLTAVRLVHAGLGQLQLLNGANDFYHLPLLTLASGFERLMKVMLCLRTLEETGDYPPRNAFPRGMRGHDLEILLQRIRQECFLDQYVSRIPVAREDLDYLQSDALLDFVRVLSRFGQAARYHYLNVVLGERGLTSSPEDEWQKLESIIVQGHSGWLEEMIAHPGSPEVHRRIAMEVVQRLERFARALARLFTIGGIGKEAKRYTAYISSFLHLDEGKLGTSEYSPVGTTV